MSITYKMKIFHFIILSPLAEFLYGTIISQNEKIDNRKRKKNRDEKSPLLSFYKVCPNSLLKFLLPTFPFKEKHGANQKGAEICSFYEIIKFAQIDNRSFFCLLFFSKKSTVKEKYGSFLQTLFLYVLSFLKRKYERKQFGEDPEDPLKFKEEHSYPVSVIAVKGRSQVRMSGCF